MTRRQSRVLHLSRSYIFQFFLSKQDYSRLFIHLTTLPFHIPDSTGKNGNVPLVRRCVPVNRSLLVCLSETTTICSLTQSKIIFCCSVVVIFGHSEPPRRKRGRTSWVPPRTREETGQWSHFANYTNFYAKKMQKKVSGRNSFSK